MVAQALTSKTVLTLERVRIYALARFYLTAEDCAMIDFQNNYTQPGSDWFDAIAYNVGRPKGDYFNLSSVAAAGISVTGPAAAADNVVGRRYTKALVLVKTRVHSNRAMMTDAQSQVTVSLDGDYNPLQSDGTLGPVTRQVVLSDFEGAILIPSSAAKNPT